MREAGIDRFSDVIDLDFQAFQDWVAESANKAGGLITDRTLKSRIYGSRGSMSNLESLLTDCVLGLWR